MDLPSPCSSRFSCGPFAKINCPPLSLYVRCEPTVKGKCRSVMTDVCGCVFPWALRVCFQTAEVSLCSQLQSCISYTIQMLSTMTQRHDYTARHSLHSPGFGLLAAQINPLLAFPCALPQKYINKHTFLDNVQLCYSVDQHFMSFVFSSKSFSVF